jgi:hypothetical protein
VRFLEALPLLFDRKMPRLHELGLSGADRLLRRLLAAWPQLGRLTRFECGLDSEFASWLLAKAKFTPRIDRLDLGGRCHTDAALRSLIRSSWTRGVRNLGFGHNHLTPGKVSRLASAPFARHLESLHLGSESGHGVLDALRVIADDRHFPRLRDVVTGSDTEEGGIEVLRKRFGPRLRVWSDC